MNSPLRRRVAAWASQRCRAGRSCPLRTRPFQSWRRAMSDFSATSSTTDSCKRPRRPCRLRAAICSAKRIASSLPEPYRDSRLAPSLSARRSLGLPVNSREDTLSVIAKERSLTRSVEMLAIVLGTTNEYSIDGSLENRRFCGEDRQADRAGLTVYSKTRPASRRAASR